MRADGSFPPQGATAENDEGQVLGVVGMDGETFVAGLPAAEGHFVVRWGAARQNRCRVNYALPGKAAIGAYLAVEAICD
ncbi:FimD/PapC C-terminal domain-containing protein [Burkholderia pseudomallei]